MSFVETEDELKQSRRIAHAMIECNESGTQPCVFVDALFNLFSSYLGSLGELDLVDEQDIRAFVDEFHLMTLERLTTEGVLSRGQVH